MFPAESSRSSRPAVHGHRGARGRMPENTLGAVSYAIACGANGAEVDICATADNILVVHHDLYLSPDLACDQNGQRLASRLAIRSQTAAQLACYDVGQLDKESEYGKRYLQQAKLPNCPIPTLVEFIEKILDAAGDQFVFNIELKGDPENPDLNPNPDKYIDLLLETLSPYLSASTTFSERLFIQSFDCRLVLEVLRRRPDFLCGLLTDQQQNGAPRIPVKGEASAWTKYLDLADFKSVPHLIASTGAGVWSSQFNDLNQELVEEAHQRGLAVYCWTVNKAEDMEKMIALGVDVITTDYPERLVQLLRNL